MRLGGASEPLATRKVTIKYTILYSRFVVDHSLEEEKEREKTLLVRKLFVVLCVCSSRVSASTLFRAPTEGFD